ncbi:AP-4 complex accessory subunit RUSC2 isoform 2-T3 [Syngnathus typhle]
MDGPPKLSGETLIVHHIPLVHCQVSGRRRGVCGVGSGSLKRGNPFSPPENLGLSRTTSLPERDVLQREALLYSSLIQTSAQNTPPERKGGGSTASDDSSFTSSISDEQLVAAHTIPRVKTRSRHPIRCNPFLVKTDDEEYEDEEDDEDDDNLAGYLEDSSFHLHGLAEGASPPFCLRGLNFASESRYRNGASQSSDPPELGRRHGSSGSNMSVDCGEHEWEDDEDEDPPMPCGIKTGSYSSGSLAQHCSCCTVAQNLSQDFPDAFPECPRGYCSDSSCNSSDGVLVNFSTIYNKMNNGVPEKPGNLNSPAERPSAIDQRDPIEGAFYLDLLTSPTEPPLAFSLGREPSLSAYSSCSAEHQAAVELDANCNSFCPTPAGGDVSCLQSRARLVVASQNYYKLVTCELSSQSPPSPAGSSVHSGSEEHSRGSPPCSTQPSEYFLFRQRANQQVEDEGEDEKSVTPVAAKEDEDEEAADEPDAPADLLQVYVNVSPPQDEQDAGRLRSRSYDRNLDKSPGPHPGSLERMLSCPVRLNDGGGALAEPPPAPPPRVTSFAEMARSKRRHGSSPSLKADPYSSGEFSPSREGDAAAPGCGQDATRETDVEGRSSSCSDVHPAVVRYGKDQRPTSLPIQPFTFHHQLAPKPPQPKPLPHLMTGYVSGIQASSGSGDESEERHREVVARAAAPPGSVRPSPLGSYSPVHLQEEAASSRTCSTCTPSPPAPHNLSRCPHSAVRTGPPHCTPPPAGLGAKRGVAPPTLPRLHGDVVSPLGCVKTGSLVEGSRMQNAHHLSPQALKWREYRRQNPLGGERPAGISSLSDPRRPPRRNVFDFPSAPRCRPTGHLHVKQMQQNLPPDYLSLTERPPEEFCLSPDASAASSLSSSSAASRSQFAVNMTHKRGLVKAVNTAVDLIVAHFGTSRDPDVKAKLGNSWVSPNVGHLILKYLCPALHEVLQDGLKAYVLDLIIGQRRCQPWSLVEASTQLGPSTRVLHNLLMKVNQFSELTSHSMRLNAFIFGLLNLKSLEFWFGHLLTHEAPSTSASPLVPDIIAAHYNTWGLVPLAQGACQQLFGELLLLLQPLSLLPFDLDLLFEPRLLATGREQQKRRKELLRSAGQSTTSSTLQLMRGWGAAVGDMVTGREIVAMRPDGTWPRTEASRKESVPVGVANGAEDRVTGGQRMKGIGQESEEKDVGNYPLRKHPAATHEGRQRQDRQAGWWYQLMQSSQVYIDQSAEGSKFVKTDKRRTSGERRPCRLPPPREGAVEGAESGSGGRPSWMGSPPESLLNQEVTAVPSPATKVQPESVGQGLRWGRLFGSATKTYASELKAKAQKNRLPSGWLGLDSSVLGLMAQTIGAGGSQKVEAAPARPPSGVVSPNETNASETKLSTCKVQALCHHIATETGQLSLNKGDVLRVLSKADADWLLCSTGAARGLVPIVYVSLCSTGETRDASGSNGSGGAGGVCSAGSSGDESESGQ